MMAAIFKEACSVAPMGRASSDLPAAALMTGAASGPLATTTQDGVERQEERRPVWSDQAPLAQRSEQGGF